MIKGYKNYKNHDKITIILFSNRDVPKCLNRQKRVLKDNKEKAGIPQWRHIESNKISIGSAVD